MTILSKAPEPAQEAQITRKLARVAALEFEEWRTRATKSPAFRKWFKAEYGEEPISVLEKITAAIRAAFMVDWERDLRTEAEGAAIIAALPVADDDDSDDDAPENDDGEDIGPDLPLIRPVAYDQHREDGEARTEPADAPTSPDEFGPQITRPDYPYPGDNDPGVILLGEWLSKFWLLDFEDQQAWEASHIGRAEYAGAFVQAIYFEPNGEAIPERLAEFESYSETVRRDLAKLRNVSEFESTTLADDDADDDLPDYLIDKMIPLGPSLTIMWGLPDGGKSMQAQKASVVVGSEATDLDGMATLHGPVLYVSLDLGARQKRIKRRMRQISDKLGLPYSARVVLVHDVVNLLDPKSVARLLEKHPGPWAMIVIDPLNKCVGGGDVSQPTIALPAFAGAKHMAIETGAAVVVVTHSDKKDTDIYGSVFQAADADSILHMVRHYQKDGQARNGDTVTMTWGRLKNDSAPDKAMKYIIDEAYLAPFGAAVSRPALALDSIKRPEVFKLLPTTATPIKGLRAAINAKLPAGAKPLDEKTWNRLRAEWQESGGLIEQKDGKVRRVR